mgnify:CR=1 FL=1
MMRLDALKFCIGNMSGISRRCVKKACEMLRDAKQVIGDANICVAITGSAGLGVAKASGVDFVQEVFCDEKMRRNLCAEGGCGH